jgi:hypothetical protein
LLQQLDVLDIKAASNLLSQQELEYRHCSLTKLTKLQNEEELYWLQCSKAMKLIQEDNNTKYFHLLANGRHRKTRIIQ